MANIGIGDTVRYLSTTGGGKVIKIEGQLAQVEEDDGFVTPVMVRELVVVMPAGAEKARRDAFGGTTHGQQQAEAEARSKFVPTQVPELQSREQPQKPEPVIETPTGDTLNVVLGFMAVERNHLNTTTFEAYLVNDSNYFLYFTYLSRADDAPGWTTRFAGIIEPNIQLFLEELTGQQAGQLDRVAFQYVAFKRDKPFALKAPVAVEYPMDTTKFFKVHCFHANPYFDEPVIAIDIVRNDRPYRSVNIDSRQLEDAMRQKKGQDEATTRRRAPRPVNRQANPDAPLVVDLHVGQLLDKTDGLSNADILNYQVDTFRRVMDENLRNKGKKIVFIHGKGEGVLRQALTKELGYRYKQCMVQDASFREYGYGATQVTIR